MTCQRPPAFIARKQRIRSLKVTQINDEHQKGFPSEVDALADPEDVLERIEDIPKLLASLLAGEHLTGSVARALAETMLTGEATSAQMAGLLVALRAKGETAVELAGLLEGLRAACVKVPVDAEAMGLVDTAGTGGDGRTTWRPKVCATTSLDLSHGQVLAQRSAHLSTTIAK